MRSQEATGLRHRLNALLIEPWWSRANALCRLLKQVSCSCDGPPDIKSTVGESLTCRRRKDNLAFTASLDRWRTPRRIQLWCPMTFTWTTGRLIIYDCLKPPFGFTAASASHRTQSDFFIRNAQIRLPGHPRHPCSHCVHSRQDQKTLDPPTPTWAQKVTSSREFVWPPYKPRIVDVRQAL